ncbi:hypothetical protein CO026_00770 [Candidatus Kaiserbacteria bacterium CG_4_9_14_0_2_um_filter_41_32]|uniref:Peptidase M10 metallopeptidase domain-containing protein n=1 Tax=Candidatus Kaiserbacteria bacterium CG_4_9_14_0_2_um_filter_41_32 TaxID=1974601 RepID=A0A2M8FFC0_9BACT|nr:MAG: hypothetical protein CO026_00770 [Candidatus Kaiserbacteria bacterium CG_4_9_14_0_2_um_filter_41_32]
MRKIFLITFLLSIAFSVVYFFQTSITTVCNTPIHYRLGAFDSRFEITELEAKEIMEQTATIWEKETGRDLFVYDEETDFPINFIFDDRQERVVNEEAFRFNLDSKEKTSTEIASEYENLNTKYQQLHSSYDARVATYNARLKKFNDTVEKYNKEGGAPESVFANLQSEQFTLKKEADALSILSENLARIVSNLNDLGEQGNRIISQYNDGVQTYNKNFGTTEEFTQGDYQGNEINIYKFSSQTELTRVLMHEFGHSLGLGHVEGSSSIMYYLMENQPDTPIISKEDLAAFTTICGDGEGMISRLRMLLNRLLGK